PLGWVGRFDVRTGKSGRLWEFTTEFRSAAFTPDGSAVILNGSPREPHNPQRPPLQPEAPDPRTAVVRFDVAQGIGCTPFDSPEGANEARFRATFALAVAPTGYQFAVVEQDSTITVYETATGAIRRQLHGHRNQIEQLAFTPEGLRLLSVDMTRPGSCGTAAPPTPPAGPPSPTPPVRRRRGAAALERPHAPGGEIGLSGAGRAGGRPGRSGRHGEGPPEMDAAAVERRRRSAGRPAGRGGVRRTAGRRARTRPARRA